MPLIVAHRGDRAHAPENTRRAFSAALAAGAEMIEMDLQLSADGRVVVFHDTELDSLTELSGAVGDHRASTLTETPVLADQHPPTEDSTIPTLSQVLAEFGDHIALYLELKDVGEDNAMLAEAVLAQVPSASPHVLASFDSQLVSLCRGAGRPTVWISASAREVRQHPERLEGLHALSLRFGQWEPALHELVHDRGLQAWAWTVNDRRDWWRLQRMGLDAICTDHPAAARAWREECP